MKRFAAILAAITVLSGFGAPLPEVAAFNPFGGVECKTGQEANNSAVCQGKTTEDPVSGTNGALLKITNIIAYVAGAAAVIILIVAGIYFITAGGDPAKVKSARDAVRNAVLGLLVIILARAIITFVIRRL